MLSQFYHNSEPSGNSYKYYKLLRFWQRLGLEVRRNKNSEHLEHLLSFPGKGVVGRIFTVHNWVGIRFNQPVEHLFPGNSKLGVQLAKLLKVSSEAVGTFEIGFVIYTDKRIFYPISDLIEETSHGKLLAVGGLI